ncbi:MAG: hypothetical protein GX591_11325 [Planctomycetes bacterium]|nr:hypothetical protein [Planctomycetota bacterium]
MKKLIIMILICVNLALVAVLAFHATARPAEAQVRQVRGDYTLASARRDDDEDVVFVLDNNSGVLFGIWADTSRQNVEFVILGPRDLARDFAAAQR